MIKCSTEAYAKCQEHCHHCKNPDEAYFLEGSDCDKFNQRINRPTQTNADRIRAMSDEELVKLFGYNSICDYVQDHSSEHCEKYYSCGKCLVEWLKQPAEEEWWN